MADFSVVESNDSATSAVVGSVGQPGTGLQVLGVAFAGRSSTGTGPGATFAGIYGALHLNADGSFTYLLDNSDPDTNQLAAGEVTDERFTYTYSLNGQVLTGQLVFHITGVDEAGQIVHNATSTINRTGDLTIAANERYTIAASAGIISVSDAAGDVIVNNGSVRVGGVSATSTYAMHLDPSQYYQGGTQLINNGRIVAFADQAGINDTGNNVSAINVAGITQPQTINNGVIAVRNTVAGANYASALAVSAGNAVNNGLVEAYSDTAGAGGYNLGLYSPTLINNGVIRVSGGAQANPIEIAGVVAASTDVHIENSGTIEVWSKAPGGHSIGISIFPNNSNIYQGGVILNSGRIVAEIAIQGTEGHNASLTVTNSGIIEGDYVRDRGYDVVTNAAGASWTGNLKFGTSADLFINAGTVTGRVTLGDGSDVFDGRGGTVSGGVDAGAGNDVLFSGSAADTLTGGAGADLFVYSPGDSTPAARDTITDFASGVDRIDLSRLGVTSVTISTSGGQTIVSGNATTGAFSIAANGAVAMSDLILTAQGNVLNGTAGDDLLLAPETSSTITGAAGNDLLVGGAGADLLNGGSGADTLVGGAGDDVYIIDNDRDRVIETADGGHDLVQSHIDYSLQYWVEDGTLLGNASVGLLGTAANNVLTGNVGDNEINGMAGDDVLIGGGGADYLIGGAGADRFVYRSTSDSTELGMDYLRFFEHGIDLIDLQAIDVTGMSFRIVPNNNVTAFFTDVTITTASGRTMLIRVDDKASPDDFLVSYNRVGTEGADELIGGGGNDTLMGAGGDDILHGLAGNDLLYGDAGNDTIWAGAGDDWLYGGTGSDAMHGADGDDNYVVDAGDSVSEAVGEGSDTVRALTSYALAAGSEIEVLSAHDLTATTAIDLTGNEFDNRIVGNAGVNALNGGDGADMLAGGAGADVLNGGAGIDTADYSGNFGAVIVNLAAGAGAWNYAEGDSLIGIENVTGTDFNDLLTGDAGANQLSGAGGDDLLHGGAGGDVLIGGAGADTADYSGDFGAVMVSLAAGVGAWNFAEGDSYAGIENVVGTSFSDILQGDGADNILTGGAGADMLVGNGGIDTADYAGNFGAVVVNLQSGVGAWNYAEGDSYSGIENVIGTSYDDVLQGNGLDNRLTGGGGADTLAGGGGIDTVDYSTNYGAVWINLATGEGFWNDAQGDRILDVENVQGSAYGDYLVGTAGANALYGGGGDDLLAGGAGADLLDGGAGNDTIDFTGNFGGVAISLRAGQGNWNAAEGDRYVGIENVKGTGYGDILEGDANANILTGGGGEDLFVFGAGFGLDRITDFSGNGAASGDRIQFGAGLFSGFADLMAHAQQQGGDVVITLDAGNAIQLVGVQLDSLTSSDFLF